MVQRPSENQRKVVVLRQTKPVEMLQRIKSEAMVVWWYGMVVPYLSLPDNDAKDTGMVPHNRPADCLGESDQRWCENVVQQDAGQTQV